MANVFGMWGYGDLNTGDLNDYDAIIDIKGHHLTITWNEIAPTFTGSTPNYDWGFLDDKIAELVADDRYFGVQVMVGNNAPSEVMTDVGTFMTSGGNIDGPYPKYYNPDYIDYYHTLLNDLAEHFATYDAPTKAKFLYWMVVEGATGDSEAYKGDITAPYVGDPFVPQDKDEPEWVEFRKDAWDVAYAALIANGLEDTIKIMINGGNDGENNQYVQDTFPGGYGKDGWLSHKYNFNGESSYYNREDRLIDEPYLNNRSRGESQGFNQLYAASRWKINPDSFAIIGSALTGGLDMWNLPLGQSAYFAVDALEFFNKYGDFRNPVDTNRAFIIFRDQIDYADTTRFPVLNPPAGYYSLIDPTKLNAYNNAVTSINNNASFSADYKDWLKWQKVAQYINPQRVTTIKAAFPSATAGADSNDIYNNDFIVNGAGNYSKFAEQVSPFTTTDGVYRLGGTSNLYGRYAKQFKLSLPVQDRKILVKFDENLDSGSTNDVEITVTYFDSGTGIWGLYCYTCKGLKEVKVIQNKNSNTSQSFTVTVQDFKFGGMIESSDVMIKHLNGTNTPIHMIEFYNPSKVIS